MTKAQLDEIERRKGVQRFEGMEKEVRSDRMQRVKKWASDTLKMLDEIPDPPKEGEDNEPF